MFGFTNDLFHIYYSIIYLPNNSNEKYFIQIISIKKE